ncbi:hypothetical protein [Endothiovibrio diazotrophicus]
MKWPLARTSLLLIAALPALSCHAAGWWVAPTVDPAVTQQNEQDAADLMACQTTLAAGSYGETEPNDTMEAADPLTSGVSITGQNYASTDEDWFYLRTTTYNEQVTVNFLVTQLRTDQAASWVVTLKDAAGNVLAQKTAALSATRCSDGFQQIIGDPGYYFISVAPVATTTYNDVQYGLTMTQQETAQPVASPPPNAVVFRRETRRVRLPEVAVEEADGSYTLYDATLENVPGTTTFNLIEATPVTQ